MIFLCFHLVVEWTSITTMAYNTSFNHFQATKSSACYFQVANNVVRSCCIMGMGVNSICGFLEAFNDFYIQFPLHQLLTRLIALFQFQRFISWPIPSRYTWFFFFFCIWLVMDVGTFIWYFPFNIHSIFMIRVHLSNSTCGIFYLHHIHTTRQCNKPSAGRLNTISKHVCFIYIYTQSSAMHAIDRHDHDDDLDHFQINIKLLKRVSLLKVMAISWESLALRLNWLFNM